MSSSTSPPHKHRRSSSQNTTSRLPSRTRRSRPPSSTTHPIKTEILINVYDLLPPGKLSSLLWTLGSSLLHTGIHIPLLRREYAFGGHSHANLSGVYYTKPLLEPPGGIFRCSLLQGFTFLNAAEIEKVVQDVSKQFLGESYNLLSNNCNHFTAHLCEKLCGGKAPGWLNRASRVGVALPCVVPREWIEPPEADMVDGELLDEEGEDEMAAMLKRKNPGKTPYRDEGIGGESGHEGKGKGRLKDTDGRDLPSSERAPTI